MTDNTSTKRTSLALRGAISAATATAVLLGGFGAFALWQHQETLTISDDSTIQTGSLTINGMEGDGNWFYIGNVDDSEATLDSAAGTPADDHVLSPGDVVEWRGLVNVTAKGSEMVAELRVTGNSGNDGIASELFDLINVQSFVPEGDGLIHGNDGTPQQIPVRVRFSFAYDDEFLGAETQGQDLLNGFDFDLTLEQVRSSSVNG
ncbi:MAG: alternate-type signal peptide domain-containing protein [Cellulomonadaceae bacterium]|nr:alternate-type signal peptide domain-containing protein [Cellulomonadaceae bacterium]